VTEQAEAEAVLAFASLFRRRTLMSTGSVEPPSSASETEVESAPVATQSADMDEPAAAEDTKMPILVLSPVRGSDNTTSASQDAMERADPHSLSPQGGASRGPSASSPLATTEKVRAPHPATETIEPGSEKAVSDVRRALFRLGLVINPAV